MATGDQNDIVGRLRSLTPANWFMSGQTPIYDAVLNGIASVLSLLYAMITYLMLQTRIQTSTDAWLDLFAADFFGNGLLRRQGQSDASYRALIMASLFPEKITRTGIIRAAVAVTGNQPVVIALNRPADTGGYSMAPLGYGTGGAYATQNPAFAGVFIVKVARPAAGTLQYGAQDADIYSAINNASSVTSIPWVQLL